MVDKIDNEIKRLIEEYPKLWIEQSFKENTVFSIAGSVATHNYYIESGVLKIYNYDADKDIETIVSLASAGDSLLPYRGVNIIPAMFNIAVVKPVKMRLIDAKNWNNLAKTEPLDELLQEHLIIVINRLQKNQSNKILIYCGRTIARNSQNISLYSWTG